MPREVRVTGINYGSKWHTEDWAKLPTFSTFSNGACLFFFFFFLFTRHKKKVGKEAFTRKSTFPRWKARFRQWLRDGAE